MDLTGNSKQSNPFSFIEEEQPTDIAPEIIYFPTAFQIKRKLRFTQHSSVEILDTIAVMGGAVESARKRAISRAEKLGNCFVVGLFERLEHTV